MALLVTDQGEIDSLRSLLNATHTIPRNLVLKLYTSNTTPEEQHVPHQNNANLGGFWEPYDASNNIGYGTSPNTGYPVCVNNRNEEDQQFADQRGILLNGNRWDINTKASAVVSHDGSGTTGTYQLTVDSVENVKKGDYVTGTGIALNTYVVDIDGLDLELSQKLTATITSSADNVSFGRGRTTASYPEQVFTFSNPAGNVYGYYLARANNMPLGLHGVEDGGTLSADTTIELPDAKGVIGNNFIELKEDPISSAISSGVAGTYEFVVADSTGVEKGQIVTGTNIPAQTRVVGKVTGTHTIYIDKAIDGGAASGNAVFQKDITANLTVGQRVSKSSAGGNTGPDAFPAGTTITGIDYAKKTNEQGPRVYLSATLTDNVGTASSNDKVFFKQAKVTTNPSGSNIAHQLNPGDVVYIAQGTGTATVDAAHYTVFSTPTTSTFTTTPAIAEDKVGKVTIYSSIFFAERFTNGPYAIQNNGDQIKVTLNVSLD